MSDPIIKLEGLGKDYGDFVAVNDLNLEVHKGEIFGFIGPNGAGKTTTIKMLIDAANPSRGAAFINGLSVHKHPIQTQKHIGYIPETTTSLYFDMPVKDFLVYSGRLKGIPKAEAKLRAEKLLKIVGLDEFSTRKIGKMSTGMKQRANMAQALMGNPDIIIADEPTLGLDPVGKNDLLNLLLELKHLGKTIFVSSHILDELEKIVDRVAIINRGTITFEGTLENLQSEFKPDVFFIKSSDQELLSSLLKNLNVNVLKEENHGFTIRVADYELLDKIITQLYSQSARVMELTSVESPLERLFFDKVSTKDSQDSLDLELIKEVIG